MTTAIIVLLILGSLIGGNLNIRLRDSEYNLTVNWFTLVALILFLIKF